MNNISYGLSLYACVPVCLCVMVIISRAPSYSIEWSVHRRASTGMVFCLLPYPTLDDINSIHHNQHTNIHHHNNNNNNNNIIIIIIITTITWHNIIHTGTKTTRLYAASLLTGLLAANESVARVLTGLGAWDEFSSVCDWWVYLYMCVLLSCLMWSGALERKPRCSLHYPL